MKRLLFSLLLFGILFPSVAYAQAVEKSTYNIGYDPLTQGLYLGFNHAVKRYSVGLDIGSSFGLIMPLSVSLCIDNALYFGKPDKYNLRTWHTNVRLAYSKIIVENKPNVLYIVPSIGKVFNLSNKLGLNIELGYGFQVLEDWGNQLIGEGFSAYYFGGVSTPNIRIELQF